MISAGLGLVAICKRCATHCVRWIFPTIKGFRSKFPCQPFPVELRLQGLCLPCSISRKGTPEVWFSCSMAWGDPVLGKV